MTYRELLELYKTGELELKQRKKVEKDIERQCIMQPQSVTKCNAIV